LFDGNISGFGLSTTTSEVELLDIFKGIFIFRKSIAATHFTIQEVTFRSISIKVYSTHLIVFLNILGFDGIETFLTLSNVNQCITLSRLLILLILTQDALAISFKETDQTQTHLLICSIQVSPKLLYLVVSSSDCAA